MARYIDADALQAEIEKPLAVTSNHEINWANKMAHDLMLSWLQNAPTADVAPVRHGRWKKYSDSTLMQQTKRTLVEMLRAAENTIDVIDEMNDNQYKLLHEIEPVRHGRWIETMSGYKCRCCNSVLSSERAVYWKYCPKCGARMDGDE